MDPVLLACDVGGQDAPADAKEFDGVAGKFEAHFSSNPGEGD